MAIVVAALLHAPGEAAYETLQGPYQMTLAWKGSPSPDVTGYRVHYGVASGNHTASIVVGNVTKATVPGLENGTMYYFTVVAVNGVGMKSEPSDVLVYQIPKSISKPTELQVIEEEPISN